MQARGLIGSHLLRNSSLFISIAITEIVRTTSANYSRLSEMTSVYNKAWSPPWVTGAWSLDSLSGMARMSKEITRQATMIGFTNAFTLYTILTAIAVPLCLLARPSTSAR